ncbi:MAG: MFS transporter [Nanoarchaeota archaeon]|nr:MFS transporter [Nanoarchaeota archaeon]
MIEIILVALAAFLIVALFITAIKKTFKIAVFIVLFFAVFSFIGAKFLPESDFLDRGKGYIVGKAGEVVDDVKESVAEKVQEEIDDAKESVAEKVQEEIDDAKAALQDQISEKLQNITDLSNISMDFE